MKSRVLLFVAVVIPLLCVIPAVNLWFFAVGDAAVGQTLGEFLKGRRKTLYRVDVPYSSFARALYPFGISTDPGKVIIGRHGWLFLGDLFASTISRRRLPIDDADVAIIEDIAAATEAWRLWLADQGVRAFFIQVAPDKSSIYPEYAPGWARPRPGTVTDTLFAKANPGIFLDCRPGLLAGREFSGVPLYYQTDTHWNHAGAWLGYLEVMRAITESDQVAASLALTTLAAEQVRFDPPLHRDGGDLARFLQMESVLQDLEIPLRIETGLPLLKEEIDFASGETILVNADPSVNPPAAALLARSPNALNQRRLLWLRDSFGVAMSPFMSATFSEIIHLHYRDCPPQEFARLVREFRPDYVLVTVVEMAVLSEFFTWRPLATQGNKRVGWNRS